MKVLALGGCGQEGKTTVKDLAKSEDISSVVIGDINIENADKFKAELADEKVSTLHVDVNDHDKLLAAMKGADVVVNFAGPFYKQGVKVIETAVEAKKNYVDICDDYDATRDMLALDEKAKAAGITAIIGMGASPGVTNLFAKHGADKLDQVDEIEVKWFVAMTDVDEPGASAALYHGLHMIDGNVPQYLDGKFQDVPALTDSEIVVFPEIGETEVYYVGHPEPVTLPLHIKGLKECTCKGGVPGLDEGFKVFSALGLTGAEPIDIRGEKIDPKDIAATLIEALPMPEELPPPLSGFMVWIRGNQGGDSVEYVYSCYGRMSPWTGIPASIGTQMLGKGEIRTKGVLAPEGCVDTNRFFAEIAKRGMEVEEVEQRVRTLK
jgi:saccharopine dehydrogenase (NAD+, L-lysine-forming)